MRINGMLMEITGIQPYIFGSNKLRMNIGASDIVDKVFLSIEEITEQLNLQLNTDPSSVLSTDIDIILKGGGNIMMVSRDKDNLRSVARQWHKMILEKYPGLCTNLATSSIESNENVGIVLQKLLVQLRDELFKNKNSYHPITVPMGLGINSICKYTGLPAETFEDTDNFNEVRISKVASSKFKQSIEANEELHKKYEHILGTKKFILNLDKFRRINESKSNYLSIVHIDGNEIGNMFSRCKTISETIELSSNLEQLIKSAFEHITKIMVKKSTGNLLPLRPIIIGGDDITFITDYKSGIYLSEKFIEFIKKENNLIDNLEFCAGVAIVKIKYPFARAYELAERLCSKAKEQAREKGGSWINFIVNGTGFTGDIGSIIEKYDVPEGNLLFRPYSLSNSGSIGLSTMLDKACELNKWPKNKIKGFERVLHNTKNEIIMYIKENQHRSLKLPIFEGENYDRSAFVDKKTPYYDMMELMEFYPMEELR